MKVLLDTEVCLSPKISWDAGRGGGSPAVYRDLERWQRLLTAARVGTGAVNILQIVQQPQKYPCVGNPEQAERHQPLVPFPVAVCPGLKDESPALKLQRGN